MANRNTLSVSKLGDFKKWLVFDGWEIADAKGYFEVVRATKKGKKYPLVVYKRLSTDNGKELVHYSVLDRDLGIVKAFLKSRRADNG